MLPIAFASLTALLLSLLAGLTGQGVPAAVLHLAFAVGVLPLIFAAMLHFVPVLTRTGEQSARIRRLPWLAQLAGIALILAMQGILPYGWVSVVAAVDLILAAILLGWIRKRMRATLGKPHPGCVWYVAALIFLMLALIAILGMRLFPEHWQAWRGWHLHLNTLGLVGMAALGTLPVLLPTALGLPDAKTAVWLKRHWRVMAAGVILLAGGAALYGPLSIVGGALLLLVALRLLGQWLRCFGLGCLWRDGAASLLSLALVGWCLTLLAGAAHAVTDLDPRLALWAWVVAFLMPLVTGALSQLLPVWRWPGPKIPARDAMRARLVAGGQWRGLLFLAAGIGFLLDFSGLAALLVAAAMAMFLFNLLLAMRIPRSTR